MSLSSLLSASFQKNELIGLSPFNFSILIRVYVLKKYRRKKKLQNLQITANIPPVSKEKVCLWVNLSHSFAFIIMHGHHYLLSHAHSNHNRTRCQQLHEYEYSAHNQNCNIMTNIMPKGEGKASRKRSMRRFGSVMF